MRKLILFLGVFALILSMATYAYAKNPGAKLQRGVINIVTSPLEIPKQTIASWDKYASKSRKSGYWLLSGLFEGVVNTAYRFVSGVWDVVTLNNNIPAGYAPLMYPEYVFDPEVSDTP